MRSFKLVLAICLGSLLAAAQTDSSQAPTAATPKTAPKQGAKPGHDTPATKPPSPKQEAEAAKEVAPDAAVITIKGLCSTPTQKAPPGKAAQGRAAAKPADCKTVITRKQLELLIETVRPNLQPAQRRTLAQQYVELLVVSNAAVKAGVEKEPKVQEQMRLSKLQILATSYSREMQQKEAEVPEADIEKYYKEHASQYEEAKLLRIYVPMVAAEEGKPPDVAASKDLAEKIQRRAAAGEDFDKLQKEAFTDAGSKGTPPPVDIGERRRGTLPPKQENGVFGLKVGEVSPALEEASGFYIYKVVGKDEAPLDKVRAEIKSTLAREHTRESMEKLRTSVQPTFNDAYFGSEPPPASGGELHPPTAPAHPATPSATPEAPKPTPPGPPQSK
jgi:parvulin-like peptidyl-prolyl isomerase